MTTDDFAWIKHPAIADFIRSAVMLYRKDKQCLAPIVTCRYGPDDDRRWSARRVIRELADIPDVKWPAFPK